MTASDRVPSDGVINSFALLLLCGTCLRLAYSLPQLYLLGLAGVAIQLALSILAPIRFVPIVLFASFLGPDIAFSAVDIQSGISSPIASPWGLKLGPLSSGVYQFLIICVLLLRIGHLRMSRPIGWLAIYVVIAGTLGLVITVLSQGNLLVPVQVVIEDVRMGLYIVLGFAILATTAHLYPYMLPVYVKTLLIVCITVVIADVLVWSIGQGPTISGALRASLDSTKWLAIFPVVYALARPTRSWRESLVSLLLLTLGGFAIWVYSTRLVYVEVIIGLFLVVILKKNWTWLLKRAVFVVAAIYLIVITMSSLSPEFSRVYEARAAALFTPSRSDEGLRALDPTRLAEIENLIEDMLSDGSIFFGRGFGGFYSETVHILPEDLTSAFPKWVEQSRRFPTVHFVLGHVVLKFGLVGLFLWTIPWVSAFISLRTRSKFVDSSTRYALIALLPAVFLSGYWSSKGLMMSGLVLGLAHCLASPSLSFVKRTGGIRSTLSPTQELVSE